MSSNVDIGKQNIGWKFSTPLQADYLNSFLAGITNPGLLTRPHFQLGTPTSAGIDVTISPFSLLMVPNDKFITEYVDENNKHPILKVVKLTTTVNSPITISQSDIAIGFEYSFTTNGTNAQAQWYGEFVPLDSTEIDSFLHDENGNPKGIIIATVQYYNNEGKGYYSISTNGADISDALLREEGWNPNCWVSLVHPSRTVSGRYNKLEVRKHNNHYSGYMNGNLGCVRLADNLYYNFDRTIFPAINEHGERGFMPYNYTLFSLQTKGFYDSDASDTMPIEKTHGGVFAIVDASNVNPPSKGMGNNNTFFSNKLKISPVQKEDINIYYNNNTLVIN